MDKTIRALDDLVSTTISLIPDTTNTGAPYQQFEADNAVGWRVNGDMTSCVNYTFTATSGVSRCSCQGLGSSSGGWGNIAKIAGQTATDMAKCDPQAVADVAKVDGVAV